MAKNKKTMRGIICTNRKGVLLCVWLKVKKKKTIKTV